MRGKRAACPVPIAYSAGAFRVSMQFGGVDVRAPVRSGVCAATRTRKKYDLDQEGFGELHAEGD